MKGPMKLIDRSSGLMECRICGSSHFASLQSGLKRADASLGTAEAAINAAANRARRTKRIGIRRNQDGKRDI